MSEKVREFFSNDIVCRFDKNKRVVFGVVVHTYETSSEDMDERKPLQKGQIRVLWSNMNREQIWRQSKVRLINRSIIPGDIVRRLEKAKETQRGYCKEAKQITTVQIVGTDKVVEHVCSDRLRRVRPYDIDDAVCIGDKFGRIESIDQIIRMQSKDGSLVEVLTSLNGDIDDYWWSKQSRVSVETFYPGQEVICAPSNFVQPNWERKTKTMKRNIQQRQRFTIQSVQDCLFEVSIYVSSKGYSHVTEISSEDLKKIKVLEHPSDTCLELSERCLLKLGSQDVLLKKKDWVRKLSLIYRPDVPKVRHLVNCNSKIMSRLSKKRSSSHIYPGALTPNTPPTTDMSNPMDNIIVREEIAEDSWTEDGTESDDDENEGGSGASSRDASMASKTTIRKRHYPPKPSELVAGHTLPVEVICVESKVTVVWQDGTEEKDIPSTQLYYSISLDDHEFFPGEWVVMDAKDSDGKYGVVQHVNYMERTATIKWFTYSENEKKPEAVNMAEMSVYDLKKHSKYVFRPGSIVKAKPTQEGKMGKVIDSCIEGYVIVQWIEGKEENCWPQDIELIPDSGEYDYSDTDSESGDDEVSWETESIESFAGDDLTDETVLQNIAARLDFVRSRIVYLREAFREHLIAENFAILKDLLLVYENSSYLDKILGTSFFSLKSKHFQAILLQAKEKAKAQNIELRGRLFSSESGASSMVIIKTAESENIKKMIKLENKINAEIEKKEGNKETSVVSTPITPDSVDLPYTSQENLCVELLSALKNRMDLAYAEVISKIGGSQALSVLTKTIDNITPTAANSTPMPSFPSTPDDSFSALCPPFKPKRTSSGSQQVAVPPSGTNPPGGDNEWYSVIEEAPLTHHYYTGKFDPTHLQKFLKAVMKEYNLLRESLPPGVWVRSFSNRIDLLSVMIRGPANTPYEDGLFLFDIQLSPDYPRSPPVVHYISYSSERLNPNLYVEGKVCVSLLGTWMGKGTEVWGTNSTLLQLIVSIQGLILVAEPYYNEAGYDKQTDSQQGYENSRTYNELVILKLVQSMSGLLQNPPSVFKSEIFNHFVQNGEKLCQRLEKFCSDDDPLKPEFPLLPVSKGLKISLATALNTFREILARKVQNSSNKDEQVL